MLLGTRKDGVRAQEWQQHRMWRARKSEEKKDSKVSSPRGWEGDVAINLDLGVSKL